MYSYAARALLHYARWAEQHEYPYLEKPEILEYPTETWAAQDMRKSEVFNYAAQHSRGDERQLLRERARFFFDSSVEQLSSAATRTMCRPLVLMLSLGYRQGYFDTRGVPEARAPGQAYEFGEPEVFLPQKERAKRTLVRAGMVGAVLTMVAGLVGFVVWRA
jgi:hypothetical protein